MKHGTDEVLVVVDVQNDFCLGGALAVPGGDAVVPAVNALASGFANVVLTQDWHPEGHVSFAATHGAETFSTARVGGLDQVMWPIHCVQGSKGAELHPGLDVPHAQLVLRKGFRVKADSYSAFKEADGVDTGLAAYLRARGVSKVAVAGLATDFCVAWTALDARSAGFEVTVHEEACRGIDLDGSLAATWERMAAAGVVRA